MPQTELILTRAGLQFTARMPGFAADVSGLNLGDEINAEQSDALKQALLDYEVLFFPAQPLNPSQHIRLANAFGPLAPGSYFKRHPEHPEMEIIEFNKDHPPEINVWHSDLTWKPQPPIGTVIQITEMPVTGGNTCWASMSKAFAGLSAGMQTYLEGLEATHTWEVSAFRDQLEKLGEEPLVNAIRKFKPATHPVVRTHPESGKKCLFVNETFTRQINGVHHREGKLLLQFLLQWLVQPEFIVHHRWDLNGIAVWDNRSTQHYAAADYFPAQRITRRVTFGSAQQ
jgi:taurine dioxygenase